MKQQRRYKEPQDTLWGKFLSGFMAVVFAMSTLTLIPIASAINGEPNEAQIQQQEELADQTSGKDEKAAEPAADEQKLEPVELLSIASVEDEDDADDAAPADVTLKVKAQNATVTYNGNDAATELVVPADKDVKFTVKAADGFTLGAAAVKLADAKGETTLTPNAGEYTVAADRVADGATIVVTAEAVAGSANTDAAEPSTPAPSTELGEKMEMAKSVVTSIIDSVFGGTSTLANNDHKVAVGETINLESKNGTSNHSWESNKTGVAKVVGKDKNATVTGVSAGTATITHTYSTNNGNKKRSETFEITVSNDTTVTYPVYVYIQLAYSSSITDAEKAAFTDKVNSTCSGNGNAGWYTIGKINNAIPTAPSSGLHYPKSSIALNEMDKYNSGINQSLVAHVAWNENAHVTDNGADSYDVSGACWHLDGTARVVKYTWKDGYTDGTLKTAVDFENTPTLTYPADPTRLGYTFDRWNDPVADGNGDYVITANWKKDDSQTQATKYTVRHVVDGVEQTADTAEYTSTAWVNDDPAMIAVQEGSTAPKAYTGYKFDSISTDAAEVESGTTITLTYVKDSFPYTVNYVDEDGNALLDPKTGAPQEFESVISSFDEVIAIEGYVFERANTEQLTIGADADDNVIILTYAVDVITDPNNDGNGENPGDGIPDKYQAVVNYESANDAQGTVNLAQKVITFANNATSGTVNIFDGVATNPTAGFVFDGWTEDGNAVASNLTRELQGNTEYTFIANWALDVIGTDPTDPGNNAPDGIADKYQLVVTYAAIAGTIDGPTRYVLNKYDAAGNLAEDGVAVLTAAQIPGATADDGYGNGVWNNEPLANMELTDDTAFVIAFTALPAAAVVVPPLAPVAAAAPAAAAAAAATILDDGVPLATIDDDENALAAFEEIHCWTHWLMIFGALVTIVYGLAVLYRRRHGIRDMDDFEGDIMGGRKYDAATERNLAAGNAFQAM